MCSGSRIQCPVSLRRRFQWLFPHERCSKLRNARHNARCNGNYTTHQAFLRRPRLAFVLPHTLCKKVKDQGNVTDTVPIAMITMTVAIYSWTSIALVLPLSRSNTQYLENPQSFDNVGLVRRHLV
jgi:hypothetical protein